MNKAGEFAIKIVAFCAAAMPALAHAQYLQTPQNSYPQPYSYPQSPYVYQPPRYSYQLPQYSYTQQQSWSVVGIPSDKMDAVAAEQRSMHWCWAAAIQMALSTSGVSVTQEQIVRQSYGTDNFGNLPDWGANFDVITSNLTGWVVDQNSKSFRVNCTRGVGAPPPSVLVSALHDGHAVILAYITPEGGAHAVVCTAAMYTQTSFGPYIGGLVVRDPWPRADWDQTHGRITYPAAALAPRITGYWIVDAQAVTSPSAPNNVQPNIQPSAAPQLD